jgi:predicted nucleic acid-binding OB-fold protein
MQHRKILLDRGRGYHREAVYHAVQKRNFSIFNTVQKKKVAVTIQDFVGTKTGWFRGFCSYYVEKGEDEGRICSGNERGKGMSWHTRSFCTILLYFQHIPPF